MLRAGSLLALLFVAVFTVSCSRQVKNDNLVRSVESFDTQKSISLRRMYLSDVYKQKVESPLYIIMLGAPGIGKGTHSTLISRRYSIPILSMDTIIAREELNGNSQARELLKTDETAIQLLTKYIRSEEYRSGFVLDGFPKTIGQARAIDRILQDMKNTHKIVINLTAQDSELLDRFKQRAICVRCNSGRINNIKFYKMCFGCRGDEISQPDETEQTMKERLSRYHKHSAELVDYYKKSTRFISIDAKQNLGAASNDIKVQVNQFLNLGPHKPFD